MTKHLIRGIHESLSELEWVPGELLAFDNTDFGIPSPLILMRGKELVKGYEGNSSGIRLLYNSQDNREEWTLYPRGKVLALWSPNHINGERVPNIELFKTGSTPYPIECALAGTDAINSYIPSMRNFSFYAETFRPKVNASTRLEMIAHAFGLLD